MADKLTRSDLYSLESYHEKRAQMRTDVIAHKITRKVVIDQHAALYFEDRLTVQYQIQEMLRVERIFQGEAIEQELDAYNPLIPDGDNLKATFMLEYDDVAERRHALTQLRGVEDRVWLQVGEGARLYAIADEDLERANDVKTSAVHFLRFQLDPMAIAQFKDDAVIRLGIDHENYDRQVVLAAETAQALRADLD
jgi:hypothetical protein